MRVYEVVSRDSKAPESSGKIFKTSLHVLIYDGYLPIKGDDFSRSCAVGFLSGGEAADWSLSSAIAVKITQEIPVTAYFNLRQHSGFSARGYNTSV